ARRGFAVAPKTAYFWARAASAQLIPNHGDALLVSGRAPRAGEVFRNPALAQTLERIAAGGAEAFYDGPVAGAIVDALKRRGGVMTARDLAEHRSTWDEPIATELRQMRIHECAPSGQGLTALIALNILAELGDLGAAGSAERMHLI